jgi:transcription elongation factor GreA
VQNYKLTLESRGLSGDGGKKNRRIAYESNILTIFVQKYDESSAFSRGILLFFVLIRRQIMSKVHYITEEGLQKMRAELEHLRSVERPELSRQIAEARDKGDLSENAEYDAAKEAQALLEMKISKLERLVANARVIDETKIDTSKVQIMSKVKLKNLSTKKTMEYTLVPESEANLKENKLSIGTPIAQALMGHEKGEVVEVQVPAGRMKVEILEISI